jgi:SH3 domain-containing kinase-binding protein 1
MAKCVFEYEAENEDELSLKEGDIVTVTSQEDDGWWEGELNGKSGMFPSNFVEELPDDGSAASGSESAAVRWRDTSATVTRTAHLGHEQKQHTSVPRPALFSFPASVSLHPSSPQAKPKKFQGGVGLGNIFAQGEIKLKKTSGPRKSVSDKPKPVLQTVALKPTKSVPSPAPAPSTAASPAALKPMATVPKAKVQPEKD